MEGTVLKKRGRDRTAEEKRYIIMHVLLMMADNGKRKLTVNNLCELKSKYGCDKSFVYKIFKQYADAIENDEEPDFNSKRRHCGGNGDLMTELLVDKVFEYCSLVSDCSTYRDFTVKFNAVYGYNLSFMTVWRWFQKLGVSYKYLRIKPELKDCHRRARLQWILNKVEDDKFKLDNLRFHLSEKWFYAMKKKDDLSNTSSYQDRLEKVMFIAVIGTPHWYVDPSTGDEIFFDGKIGMWPVTEVTSTVVTSTNQSRGVEVFNQLSLSPDVYFDFMLKPDGVLATIKQKFPFWRGSRIVIQHDSTSAYTGSGHIESLNLAGSLDGWNISWEEQPPHSPDFNKCDLGFFSSIQAEYVSIGTNTHSKEDIIAAMEEIWLNYPWDALEKLNGFQYAMYREILDHEGGNQFKSSVDSKNCRDNNNHYMNDYLISARIKNKARKALNTLLSTS